MSVDADSPRGDSGLVHPLRLRTMIDTHGGFTVRLRTGEQADSGISVVTSPSRSLHFRRDRWSDRDVQQWLEALAAKRRWRPAHVGGWLDWRSDTVWLDVVSVMPASLLGVACVLGRATRQHCVFDLGRRETVVL